MGIIGSMSIYSLVKFLTNRKKSLPADAHKHTDAPKKKPEAKLNPWHFEAHTHAYEKTAMKKVRICCVA